MPFSLFTDRELARVGLNEAEAGKQRIAFRIARLPTRAVLRTRTTGESAGFMKVLVESPPGESVLGFTMIGCDAGEVLAAVQTATCYGRECGPSRASQVAR